MMNDDEDIKDEIKKSMSEPVKKRKTEMPNFGSEWLLKRRKEHEDPHGNEVE